MKIGKKVGDNEALSLLDPTLANAQQKASKKANGLFGEGDGDGQDVQLDIALGQSIGMQLDPSMMEAERRAKVEDIKRRVQSKSYIMPSSDEIAEKLAEEINFELADAARTGNR